MSINGKLFDWEDLTIVLPHGPAFGITELAYKDSQDATPRYGKGNIPRGYGRGNYEASGSMTLDADEWERFAAVLMATGLGAIYDHLPFVIIASYANLGLPPITDVLPKVKITGVDTSNSQGSDNAGQKKIEFKILSPILYNAKPAKLPVPV